MEYITVGLIILVFILLYILFVQRTLSNKIYKENKTIKEETIKYQDTVESFKDANEKARSYYVQSELKLKEFILLLAKSHIKVYTQGTFYSAYSFYNGRFYAKVNNNDTHNKAEGIPIISIPNNKNAVIDLYLLLNLHKLEPMININEAIKKSTRLKEDIIKELGNKVLKSYRR